MSGGGIGNQGDDDSSQLVVFSFSGRLKPEHVKEWNQNIKKMKLLFGSKLAGVTTVGVSKPGPAPAPAPRTRSKPKPK